jgi:hypothetical protein
LSSSISLRLLATTLLFLLSMIIFFSENDVLVLLMPEEGDYGSNDLFLIGLC